MLPKHVLYQVELLPVRSLRAASIANSKMFAKNTSVHVSLGLRSLRVCRYLR